MTIDAIVEALRLTGRPFALLVEDPPATTQAVRIAVHAPEGSSHLIQAVDHLSSAMASARATITHRGRIVND